MNLLARVGQSVKSWWNGPGECANGEGGWRGPFFGQDLWDLGSRWHQFDPLGEGWQRGIGLPGRGRIAAVYACVESYAQSIALMGANHVRYLDNGGRETITTSALSRFLRAPNSYQTRSDFFLSLTHHLMLRGNAYALALRNDRQEVDSLHLLPANGTSPYVDDETKEVFYAVGRNPLLGEISVLIPARDVLHIKLHTSRHPLIGRSPLEYASAAMAINNAISNNQAAFFNNMSRPSGVLTTDEKLTKEQMDVLRDAWKARSQGINAGDVPILTWGLKWQPMTITSEDAQLVEAFRLSVEEIARVYRVPLALIGDYTKATFNNVEMLISSWLATGLGFVMEHIEQSFTKFFRLPVNEHLEFNPDTMLRTDFPGRVDALVKGIQGGLYSPNEARVKEGLKEVEYGDEPRLQAQVVPLSQVEMTPSAAPAPVSTVEPEEPTPTEEQRRFAAFVAEDAIRKAMAA